jgi:hypothetical protein
MPQQKKDAEFDLQPNSEFDLQPAPEFDLQSDGEGAPLGGDTQSTRSWALQQLLGMGKGMLKQAGTIVDAPYRLFTGAKPIPELEPQTPAEHAGAFGTEIASYLLPIGAEEKAASAIGQGLRSAYRPMRAMLGPGTARTAIAAGNTAGRAAIGGASAGATAYANEGDPISAAKWGATIPTALYFGAPAFSKVVGGLEDRARTMMARGIQPGSIVDKISARKLLDPLLNMGAVWWRNKGMQKIANEVITEASAKKAAERAMLGQRPLIDYGTIEPKLKAAGEAEFRSGRTAQGIPMSNNPSETRGAAEYDKFMNEYILPKVEINPATGERYIPFDELDLTKRSAQDYAASHGHAFLDLPQEPTVAAEAEAQRVLSNAARPELEDFAGQGWADANERLHFGLGMKRQADINAGKKLGQFTPLAETPVGGYGWHMGGSKSSVTNELPGMLTRAYRFLTRSPGWNTTGAQINWKLAKALQETEGFGPAQIAAFMSTIGKDPGVTTYSKEGEPLGIGVNAAEPEQPETTPALPAVNRRMRWDPATQQFLPVE